MLRRIALALALIVAVDWAPGPPLAPLHTIAQVKAQAPYPPSVWHPYRGGTNCVQVADINGNFNCAPGTTVDPATGNMVIGGTLTFTGFAGGAATYFPGLVVGAVGSNAQVVGTADFVLATTPSTVAAAGPLIQGVTLRVRRGPGGSCQLVVTGGNSFGLEYIIPVVPKQGFQVVTPPALVPYPYSTQLTFSGGPAGC